MATTELRRGKTVASVERVGAVLDLFAGEHSERGVCEAAGELGLSKSATHALLTTLVNIGLLERTPAARYRLGWRLLVLSRQLVRSLEYRDPVLHVMHSFASTWGDTMHLGVLDRGRVVYVHRVDGVHAVPVPTQTGVRLHAHSSAVGKVLLAALDRPALLELVEREGLPPMTANTITSRELLADELTRIRLQGYALDREETIDGISCVAAPIRGPSGAVVAAMSVCATSRRFERYWPSYVRAVKDAVAAATERLSEEERWPAERSPAANRPCEQSPAAAYITSVA
jgi:DNA-binding IclR family transcriptional regulator